MFTLEISMPFKGYLKGPGILEIPDPDFQEQWQAFYSKPHKVGNRIKAK